MAGTMMGKTALVTGAASGIGRATALAFADEGANVVVGDINENGGKETVHLVQQAGVKGLFVRCDVSKGEEVKDMVGRTVKEFGRLDFACNDAGIHQPLPEPLTDVDEDMWDKIIAVNLKGVMLCMKHEVQPMLKQGGGVIINIASLGGLFAEPGSYAYTASKHGVMGLTKVAAFQYARDGIRISAVCPAVIETPMVAMAPEEVKEYLKSLHPIGRFGKPEEVAGAVIWLCSDLSAFVTGTGVVLDGGASTI
jgi:NAD(P)-dependent dehydrogenase (short-subunit alcohol dehydrogenase family)